MPLLQDMCDFLIEIEPLAIEYNELAQQGEMEKSGEELEVPSGFAAVGACPKLTKELEGKISYVLFEWDSGWELGRIVRVNGRKLNERQCLVQFDVADHDMSDQQVVELRLDNYYTSTNNEGIWVLLVETA